MADPEVQIQGWADLPDGLLEEVIKKVQVGATAWPARRNVVACAGVCGRWRSKTLDLAGCGATLDSAGLITFPDSLRLPGPRDGMIMCRVLRDKSASTFTLRLDSSAFGSTPELADKTLLVARKIRRATRTDFIISLAPNDFSQASTNYVGKTRSDLLGAKFTVHASGFQFKKVSPAPPGNDVVATISYDTETLDGEKPRKMKCVMHSIVASTVEECDTSQSPAVSIDCLNGQFSDLSDVKSKDPDVESTEKEPLVMINKAPRWHEQLQSWVLNFRGRVTVASAKNFQLVAYEDQSSGVATEANGRTILQFGKIGKDIFTMDYRYPISAFHAFAICLSCFGRPVDAKSIKSIAMTKNFNWSQYP